MKKKIAICVSSYKRVNSLNKFLKSIKNMIVPYGYTLEIILCINGNFHPYNLMIKDLHSKLNIRVLNESKKGVVHPRNKILDYLYLAKNKRKYKYICFFDDDCLVDRFWLKSMIAITAANSCDIVGGPQISLSKNYFSVLLERHKKHLSRVSWVSTNNAFLKYEILFKEKIKFPITLNLSGGEDQAFFAKLNFIGYKIFWNNKSKVYERINRQRLNLIWFLKRNFRYGVTKRKINEYIYGKIYGLLINIIYLLYHFLNSAFLLLLLIVKINNKKKILYKFYMHLFRFVGSIFGLFNFKITEYKNI